MIGELIDSMVAAVSPEWGLRRVYARNRIKRSYDAARVDRTNSSWNAPNSSADAALLGKAERVRDRARDLARNNSYARGAIDAIVANVIGCGIVPRPALDDEPTNAKIDSAWKRWCEHADITGRLHFCEIQALACREMIEAGENLIHYVSDQDMFRVCPLALELIEAERIATDRDSGIGWIRTGAQNGNEIRRGVELTQSGKATAYWLYPNAPNGIYSISTESQRFDARDMLHLYRQDRIGQTRGVSWLAPAVLWLRDLGIYVENELQASAVASCFGVVIKTVDSGASFGGLGTPDDEESTDSNGDRFERLQPGLVNHLMPGESIECINPTRPNASADPWIALILRSISVAMGLSYELVSRDYSRTNYSSNRASALEDRRRFRPIQKFFIWHLCQPIYREFFASCVMNNVDGFPSMAEFVSNPNYWLSVNWRTPGWEWVDPYKEVMAAKVAVDELFASHGDVIESSFGGDLRETWGELSMEVKLREQLGLQKAELTKLDVQNAQNQTQDAAYAD